MTNWPVLYPVLLSFYSLLPINILTWALVLNCIATSIVCMAFYCYDPGTNKTPSYLLFTLLLSFPVLKLQIHALSEPIFICLLIMLFIQLRKYYADRTYTAIIRAALFGAFLCLQRYIGLYICISVALILLIQFRGIKHTLLFITISYIPCLLNIYFAASQNQTFTTWERAGSFDRLNVLYNNLYNYFSFNPLFTLLFIAFPFAIALYSFFKPRTRFDILLICVFLIYLLAALSSFTISFEEYLRYFLTILPILFVTNLVSDIQSRIFTRVSLFVFGLAVLSIPFVMDDVHRNGTGGYNKLKWKNDELSDYLNSNHSFKLSNAPDYLYFLSHSKSDYLSADTIILKQQLAGCEQIIIVNGIRESYMGHLGKILDHTDYIKEHHHAFTLYKKPWSCY